MAKRNINPRYSIDSLPNHIFSDTVRATWPEAVKIHTTNKMIPANATQVKKFTEEAYGLKDTDTICSSTAAVYFVKEEKPYVAFYDARESSGLDNLLIARAQENYDNYQASGVLLVSTKDDLLQKMLEQSAQDKRVFALDRMLQKEDWPYAGKRDCTAALFGSQKDAEEFGRWQQAYKFENDLTGVLEPSILNRYRLDQRCWTESVAQVCHVTVGLLLYATSFECSGITRGVCRTPHQDK